MDEFEKYFFRETRTVISEGNNYILYNARTLYEGYLRKNNICDNSKIEVCLDNDFHPDAGKVFEKTGIGAGIGAVAAMLFSGPVGWLAGAGALLGLGVSKKDEVSEAKKILVKNSLKVAKAYAERLNSIISIDTSMKKDISYSSPSVSNIAQLTPARSSQTKKNDNPPSYLQIDDLQKKITHKIFGEGILESFDYKYATIKFENTVKKIDYKLGFNKGLLTLSNPESMKRVERCVELYNKIHNQSTPRTNIEASKIMPKEKVLIEKYSSRYVRESGRDVGIDKDVQDDWNKLISIWRKYGFEGFLHTTELENFEKIVKCGELKSRFHMEQIGMRFNDKADQEVIGHTNAQVKRCCRFYYYFKTPTNYRAKYSRPVIMVFDPNIIFEKKTIRFYDGNAASARSTYTTSVSKAIRFSWGEIFKRGYYIECDENCTSEITRFRNAEFLCESPVSISNITVVYFKNENDLKEAKTFCPPALWGKFKCDRSKFD